MKISQGNFRIGFEHSYQQIENTTIKRINSEIDKVISSDDTPARLAALEKEYGKLQTNKVLIDGYAFDTHTNMLHLVNMQTTGNEAISALTASDDDTNLTADELTTLTEKTTSLVEDGKKLLLTVHPDIQTPFVVRDVKNLLSEIEALSPVEGTIDAEGSGSPSNDNRNLYDKLTELNSLMETAYTVTDIANDNAQNISLDIQATMATRLADMTKISTVELKEREAEIEDIKAKYGNILRAISLSFEARMASVEQMQTAMNGFDIPSGSVMNLFA
ncbi:hypothetical protein V5T82_07785 [Magnetovibrio sp. PR-2]|uniref:hypothetical protein n=1 Tax=Magnetovibrio sp. PR-2 TaxID=3120356 RepID=UPI002FCE670E